MRSLVVAVAAFALGCPSPSQVASTDALMGYWRPRDGQDTVFVFAKAEEAEELFSLSANMIAPQTSPVSAVYSGGQLVQLATFEATATELRQRVLADQAAPPGKEFSTRIYAFERGASLTLESKQLDGGPRLWDGYDFCPASRAFGWASFDVFGACARPVSYGGSSAFDRHGRFFAYGSGKPDPALSCPPTPAFLEVGRGCGFVVSEAPAASVSSMGVGDDEVIRLALVDLQSVTHVRERAVRGTEWTDTVLVPAANVRWLEVLHPKGVPTVLTGQVDAMGPVAFQKQGGQWSRVTLKRRTDGGLLGAISHAVTGPDGALWLHIGAEVVRETDPGFEPVPLPPVAQGASTTISSMYVDPSNVLHLAVLGPPGLHYVVLKPGGVETHLVDQSTEGDIVTHGTAPLRVLVRSPHASLGGNAWVPSLITIFDDGHFESEYVGGDANFLAVHSGHHAVGPRGEIAVSTTSERVSLRWPGGRLYPETRTLQIGLGQGASVVDSTGKYACDQPACTFDTTLGERLQMKVATKPGYVSTADCELRGANRALQPGVPCWLSIFDRPNASTARMPIGFGVRTLKTPVAQAFPSASNMGWSRQFSIEGDFVASVALFQSQAPTSVSLAGVTVPATGSFESQGLVAVNRASGTGWFLAVPREPTVPAIQLDAQGGLWAVVSVTQQATIGGMVFGASNTQEVARVHVVNGQLAQKTVLASAARTAGIFLLAATVRADGTVYSLWQGTAALAAFGVTERHAVMKTAPDGTRTVQGLTLPGSPTDAPVLASRADGVLFSMNFAGPQAELFSWTTGPPLRKPLPGATAVALTADASRIVWALRNPAPLTVDGRTLPGNKHLLSLDPTLAVSRTVSFDQSTPTQPQSWALGLVPGAVGFLSDGVLRWRGDDLSQLGNPIDLPSSATPMSGASLHSVSDGNRWFVLTLSDNLFGDVSGQVIAELKRF